MFAFFLLFPFWPGFSFPTFSHLQLVTLRKSWQSTAQLGKDGCIVQAFEPFIKLTLPLTSAISWQPAILPRSAIFCICRIFQSCWKSVFRSVLSFNPRTELFLYDVLVCVLKRPPKCVLIISWVSSPKHTVNRNWKVEQKERKWD